MLSPLCIAEVLGKIFVYVCQHASVILRQLSVHIKRNTSPPVTTQRYQCSSVCERDRGCGGGGVVCVRNMNVCLHHMLNNCLYVYVCVERTRVRVLTHCPGRDTAKTAVLVIKQLFSERKQQQGTEKGIETFTHTHIHKTFCTNKITFSSVLAVWKGLYLLSLSPNNAHCFALNWATWRLWHSDWMSGRSERQTGERDGKRTERESRSLWMKERHSCAS